MPVVRRMLKIAKVKPGEIVYDLGAGDGRILFTAVQEFGAKAVGIEIRKEFVNKIEARIAELNLKEAVRIINGNFFEINISEADVVTLYTLTSVNEKLRPKLEKELKPGARVVSHDFEVPGWKPDYYEEFREENGRVHRIYLYTIPPQKSTSVIKRIYSGFYRY